MIVSYGSKDTALLHADKRPKKIPPSIWKVASRKLIDTAIDSNDLRSPPGNRLEKLSGNLDGLYSIRINKQWRIIFEWTDDGVEQLTIIDYH
jgi:proteic killer suppression protein